MDLIVHHEEIGIPPGGPPDVAHLEHDIVRKDDLLAFLDHLGSKAVGDVLHAPRVAGLEGGLDRIPRGLVLVLHAERLDLEPDDAREISLDVLVVEDGEAQVVVDEVLGLPALLGGSLEADGETHLVHLDRGTGLLPVLDHRRGQVVQDHVDAVLVIDLLLELLGLIGRDAVQLANNLARLIETHLDLVQGVQDAISTQHLAEVLGGVDDGIRAAEGKRVILERQRRLSGGDLVNLEVHQVIPSVILGRDTGQIEALCQRSSNQQAREGAHGVHHFYFWWILRPKSLDQVALSCC
mmetsp:Transcript_1196/g.2113  ORF Transcript_1196/g.2113 Transcript_1196/m.2113 type:complete len:295 (-) Transcript_1196:30-914(-)